MKSVCLIVACALLASSTLAFPNKRSVRAPNCWLPCQCMTDGQWYDWADLDCFYGASVYLETTGHFDPVLHRFNPPYRSCTICNTCALRSCRTAPDPCACVNLGQLASKPLVCPPGEVKVYVDLGLYWGSCVKCVPESCWGYAGETPLNERDLYSWGRIKATYR